MARLATLLAAGAVLYMAHEPLRCARRVAARRDADARRRLAVALLTAVRALDAAAVPYALAGATARDVAAGEAPRASDALDFAAYRADGDWAAVHDWALRHGLVADGGAPTAASASLRYRHPATGTTVRVALRRADGPPRAARAVAFRGRELACEP